MLEDLARQELQRDPLYSCLSPAQRSNIIEIAGAIGREQAALYAGRDVSSLVSESGAHFVISGADGIVAGRTTYAEYDTKTHLITVYQRAIVIVARSLAVRFGPHCSEGLALDLILAHELFHHLETTRIGTTADRLPRVKVSLCAGLWTHGRRVHAASEIAAHTFAFAVAKPCRPGLDSCTAARNIEE